MARTDIKPSENQQKAAPAPVQKPAEEQDGLTVRAAFAKFNADASTRCALTDEDRATLDEIETMAHVYVRTADTVWRRETEGASSPEDVSAIASAIVEYVGITTAEVNLSLGRGLDPVRTPAIESATVRGVLVKKGQATLDQIDRAIAKGYARLAEIDASNRKRRAQVAYWMAHEPIRSLVHAARDLVNYTETGACDLGAPTTHVLDAISDCTRRLASIDQRAGKNPPDVLFVAVGTWRKWLPVAFDLLDDKSKSERGAA